jgi:hypothetical protein
MLLSIVIAQLPQSMPTIFTLSGSWPLAFVAWATAWFISAFLALGRFYMQTMVRFKVGLKVKINLADLVSQIKAFKNSILCFTGSAMPGRIKLVLDTTTPRHQDQEMFIAGRMVQLNLAFCVCCADRQSGGAAGHAVCLKFQSQMAASVSISSSCRQISPCR